MGNKQTVAENPWASVAQTARDGRATEARGVDGSNVPGAQVQTTAVKLPGSILYPTLRLLEDTTLSFQVQLSEPCRLELALNDIQSAKRVFDSAGKHEFVETVKLNKSGENRILLSLKSVSDANVHSLKVTLLAKNGHLLVVSKQAEVSGRTVELEEVYGIGSAKECVICLVETSDTAFVPCRHMCTCAECATMLMSAPSPERKCPICRSFVSKIVKVTANS